MKKLIYASTRLIDHVDQDIRDRLDFNYNLDKKFWTGSHFFSSARYGKDYSALNISTDKKVLCPNIDLNFNKTFEQVTDARAKELLALCKTSNRKLGVYFSGGIDSTVILSALIKNWPVEEYPNIQVFLNHGSVIENYYFFKDFILANNISYTFLDDTLSNNIELSDYVLTDGEPADKLWLVGIGLVYFKNQGADCLKYTWKEKSDTLLDFISHYVGNEYAKIYWSNLAEAIEDFPFVRSVGDWFSWINFNYHAAGHLLFQKWIGRTNKDSESWDNYQTFYQPWYLAKDYQLWSWGVHGQEKTQFTSITNYKKEAKQYIFDVTQEKFFYHFKTKMGSGIRFNPGSKTIYYPDLLIFEDGSGINQDHPALSYVIRRYLK